MKFIAAIKCLPFFAATILFFGGTTTHAEVIDPQQILSQVDRWLGEPEFEKSFHVGDLIKFVFKDCSFMSGNQCADSYTAETQVRPGKNETTEFVVEYRHSDQKVFSKYTIRKKQWLEAHGNSLRMKIFQLESFGFKVTMESLVEKPCKINSNNSCLKINFTAQSGSSTIQNIQFEYEIQNTFIGIAQIASYSEKSQGLIPRHLNYQILY